MGKKSDDEQHGKDGKGGKGKLVIVVVVVVVLAAGYFLGVKGGKKATAEAGPAVPGAPTTTAKPLPPGEILDLDPITLNLSDGRFLKVGLSLQLAKGSSAEKMKPEAAKALDAAIALLSSRSYNQLTAPGGREQAKAELSQRVATLYEGKVLGVYFTNFVMQ